MLQAMNLKDKSSIPNYLKYHHRGFMYFPHHNLLPFLRHLDAVVKTAVNDDAFCKHRENLTKVFCT